jgi:hypothetical protein
MLIGMGGNNGTTIIGGIIANREKNNLEHQKREFKLQICMDL